MSSPCSGPCSVKLYSPGTHCCDSSTHAASSGNIRLPCGNVSNDQEPRAIISRYCRPTSVSSRHSLAVRLHESKREIARHPGAHLLPSGICIRFRYGPVRDPLSPISHSTYRNPFLPNSRTTGLLGPALPGRRVRLCTDPARQGWGCRA